MALPRTRNETPTPGSQVKSNTTADLQDMVVGGRHGDLEFPIPGAAFLQWSATGSVNPGPDGIAFAAVGGGEAGYPLDFPAGTVITTIAWLVSLGGAGSITCELGRRQLITGASAAVVQDFVKASAGEELRVETYNHVIAPGYAYYLRAVATETATLGGVKLEAYK